MVLCYSEVAEISAHILFIFLLFFSGMLCEKQSVSERNNMRFSPEQISDLIKRKREDIFYNSHEWRKLSKKVIEDNHNECYLCSLRGQYSKAVMTHHVKHLKKYPELAYSRSYIDESGREQIQLMPLCYACHEAMHPKEWHKSKKERFVNDEKW